MFVVIRDKIVVLLKIYLVIVVKLIVVNKWFVKFSDVVGYVIY